MPDWIHEVMGFITGAAGGEAKGVRKVGWFGLKRVCMAIGIEVRSTL